MENNKYFIIKNCSDGMSIDLVTKDALMARITTDEYGYHFYGCCKLEFLDYMPDENDGYLDMKDNEIIVIKGNFVIPQEKIIVTQYEL